MDWESIFSWSHAFDLIDILIVWLIIYQLLKLIRGTRAVNIFNGIIIFLLFKMVSTVFQLETIDWIMNSIIQWSVIGIIIIFQPEIRNGLDHLGQSLRMRNLRNTQNDPVEQMIEEIIRACQYMAKRRIGALISIEDTQSLTEYANTGIKLDADITEQLLINIFIPNTPLHDGSVVIQDMKISSAASFLPLSENPEIPKELGTRHRAAVGLSEVTDAVVVVVSEETGDISLTYKGKIMRDLSEEEIRETLRQHFAESEDGDSIIEGNHFLKNIFQKKNGGDKNE
ncbi:MULTISPECIES: diadenylate cyclase CdaA [Aerococcus]|uniref:diadenylate cyclase CdaA n=1 Tax=Aerococcus TaxID=1375 RepID=UPI0018A7907F|nr:MULTISPECIES: diadenylate cyclase CdaA [Aerococcus]MCY3035666.1 diadenylate cyclase CdaA [Aerococcus sp. Group 2]MCY3040301.1 diadenylate cyclase CdaA [Aerococcus sp. Group 2]MCY3042004.1 diadenylate cyclase CdaA [Aerococcus sp. Group 2]MCY3043717.1 diadenylate cyclase CdaA [Aerococcus sp. Group 2]MDK6521465.1 diadenylate cyclase CdaA [Aerococcus urinae]